MRRAARVWVVIPYTPAQTSCFSTALPTGPRGRARMAFTSGTTVHTSDWVRDSFAGRAIVYTRTLTTIVGARYSNREEGGYPGHGPVSCQRFTIGPAEADRCAISWDGSTPDQSTGKRKGYLPTPHARRDVLVWETHSPRHSC